MTALRFEPDVPLGEVLDTARTELRKLSAWLDVTGDFPVAVARVLSDSGLTALCLPRALGGRGAGLRELVTAVEQVAAVDAATAWCTFIMGTAPWLLCRAEPELVDEVYARPDSRVAGVLAPTGTLTPVDGGFTLTGRWTFGSAVNACDWVAVHAVIAEDGVRRSAFALVPTADLSYREPWDGMGLRASGSGAFGITDLPVPRHRLVASLSSTPGWPDPVFRVPFRATFAACAAVLVGIAAEALAVFTDLAPKKRGTFGADTLSRLPHVQSLVAECWGDLHSARALLHTSVDELEDACTAGAPTPRQQAQLRIAMNTVRSHCLRVVDRVHHAAGGSAAVDGSRFAQLLRDAHTASQHHMFSEAITALAGSVLLGETVPEGNL
ncbi:acyl-CoA dehydrogenase family protein [Amycolatopsis sp. cg9]|uniref:acyl-CoA dehydrogenase family protein n=1 Tax=Amycolatopsis sp. cg9 TaxID=3238801 RepID=UPI003523B596